ncbi:hypothetical protein FO519_002848 [Halicephalobus sp. NKZ332]|nr:hypothetical protein FO519_002848 [Halicephalobus sp. NKZ332]
MTDVESAYVHQVYSRLATYAPSHPSHQAWPNVKKFLSWLPEGSVVLDVGCGRAQHIAKKSITLGIDTCPDMVLKVDKHPKMEIVLGNALQIPLKQEICRVLKPGGQVIFYVWAFEQPNGVFKTQDVLVPFNLHEISKSGQLPLIKFHKDSTREERIINNSIPIAIPEETCPRWFRNIFGTWLWKLIPGRQSLPPAIPAYLQQITVENVQKMIVSGIHRWSPALSRRLINLKVEEQLAEELSWKILEEAYAEAMSTLREVSYYRYYHVFRRGELIELLTEVDGMVILDTAYESGNWCLVAEKRNPEEQNIPTISI